MVTKKIYITIGMTFVALLTALSLIHGMVIQTSGDIICAGSSADPCVSYINITSNSYSLKYYFQNNSQILSFSPEIKNYTVYRRYSDGRWIKTKFPLNQLLGVKYIYKVVGYKINPTDIVKWGISSGDANADPYWYGETPSFATMIGTFQQQNRISIISQNYIDSYFSWNFQEIDSTHWLANFTIDTNFFNNATTCNALSITSAKTTCFKNLCDDFSALSLNCSNITKLKNDIANFTNYPLTPMTKEIQLPNKITFNATSGQGYFYINFPNDFKSGLSAKLGFNSTIINTTTLTAPFWNNQRAICRDSSNYIHVVYNNGTNSINYARSTDNGLTWILTSNIYAGYNPSISCDGSNIVISAVTFAIGGNVLIGISTDNGGSFSWQTPAGRIGYNYVVTEIRGNNIYVIYEQYKKDAGTNMCFYESMVFFNSTDLGSTWGTDNILGQGSCHTKLPAYYFKYTLPSLWAIGSGTSTDKLFLAYEYNEFDGISYYATTSFQNSSSSGTTWSTAVILTENPMNPSVIANGTFVWVDGDYDAVNVYVFQSANGGSTFDAGTSLGAGDYPSLALNNTRAWTVYKSASTNPFTITKNISYRNFNGASWDAAVTATSASLSNFPNAKANYTQGHCIEYVWIEGNSTIGMNITYANMNTCDTPSAPPAGDTCDCSSIQAGISINCAENCDIGACNVGGIAVTFINTGTITTSGDVTNILRTTWASGCTVVIGAGKRYG